MTGEERWRRALEDEESAPTHWEPDVLALRQRLSRRHDPSTWWLLEVALVFEPPGRQHGAAVGTAELSHLGDTAQRD
jgi:hypothetical protein